jgi:uncharacterized OsmC-like protein
MPLLCFVSARSKKERAGKGNENDHQGTTGMERGNAVCLVEYVLDGKGLSPKDVERAITLSMTKYCSATASMAAPVETSYRIIEKKQGGRKFPT